MAVHSSKKALLFERAYALWEKHRNDYDELIAEYQDLLQQKIDLGINPLEKIREGRFKEEAPNIGLFTLQYESEAEKYLNSLDTSGLLQTILDIETYLKSAIRVTLQGKIYDFKYQIKTYHRIPDFRDNLCAMNPDACGCGRSLPIEVLE